MLEYFDAHLIGLTATPSAHTLGFFNRNLVAEYPYEQSVVDGVNVGFEVYPHQHRKSASKAARWRPSYHVPVRDRRTRAVRYKQLDADLPYTQAGPGQLGDGAQPDPPRARRPSATSSSPNCSPAAAANGCPRR